MKNEYLTPKFQVVVISTKDILTTSPATSLGEIFYEGDDRDIVDRVTW